MTTPTASERLIAKTYDRYWPSYWLIGGTGRVGHEMALTAVARECGVKHARARAVVDALSGVEL